MHISYRGATYYVRSEGELVQLVSVLTRQDWITTELAFVETARQAMTRTEAA